MVTALRTSALGGLEAWSTLLEVKGKSTDNVKWPSAMSCRVWKATHFPSTGCPGWQRARLLLVQSLIKGIQELVTSARKLLSAPEKGHHDLWSVMIIFRKRWTTTKILMCSVFPILFQRGRTFPGYDCESCKGKNWGREKVHGSAKETVSTLFALISASFRSVWG